MQETLLPHSVLTLDASQKYANRNLFIDNWHWLPIVMLLMHVSPELELGALFTVVIWDSRLYGGSLCLLMPALSLCVDQVWGRLVKSSVSPAPQSRSNGSQYIYTPCPEKKRPRYFQLQLSHSLVDFYNFYTVGNRNEYSTKHVQTALL